MNPRLFIRIVGPRVSLALAVVAVLTHSGLAQTPRVLDAAYLDLLRAEVRTNHPSVAAAQARVLAAEAGVRAVRLWEDPMAGLGVRAAEAARRRDDGDIVVGAEQALPRRKLYEARKSVAAAERLIFEADKRSSILNLETLVARAAVELALADETLLIQSNQVVWLESMALNAREKLKDPMATAAGPLRIEGELAQERQRLDAAARQRTSFARQLNTLLGRPVDGMWPAVALPGSASETPALPDELSRLPLANPMLQAVTGSAAAARAGVEVARQERKPVFSVGADTAVYSGGRFVETMVAAKVTLPWFNNSVYRANADRARQQQAAAERDYEALERRLRGEAIAAYTDADNAARQAGTFTSEVTPRMEQAAQATEGAWVSSKASLLEVLEARRALLNARLEERRFIAAHLAALEMLRSIVPPPTQP